MTKWISEVQTDNLEMRFRISEYIHAEKSQFQEIVVVDTYEYGRMLLLDGTVQTTVKDEFIYHEMITHVPLFSHQKPKRVAVIGGGDGGAIREILKHDFVEKVVLCEIDERVVRVAQKFFPELSYALDDSRVEIKFIDGINYLKEKNEEFDVIIIDSPDPVGPALGLYSLNFYSSVYKALKKDGLFVAQTESPFVFSDVLKEAYKSIAKVFSKPKLYLATIPTYPGVLWSFTLGYKGKELSEPRKKDNHMFKTKYYTKDIHQGAFLLPKFVEDMIK